MGFFSFNNALTFLPFHYFLQYSAMSRSVSNVFKFPVFQIDVNSSLEKQGPLHVFLHKLTDMQSHAESGDKNVC